MAGSSICTYGAALRIGALLWAIGTCVALVKPVAASIVFYRVGKRIAYEQTSDSQPLTPVGLDAGVDLFADNPSDLTSARVFSTAPALLSPASPFVLSEYAPGGWGSGQVYPSIEAMDTNIPPGDTFGFLVEGGDLGARLALIDIPSANLFAPSIPYFTNNAFTQLNTLDPTLPITIHWNGFTPAEGVNEAPLYFNIFRQSDGQHITGTVTVPSATSYPINANTLAANTQYRAELVYSSRANIVDAGFIDADSSALFDLVTNLIFTTSAAGSGAAVVPEPGGLAIVCAGLVILFARQRSRKRAGGPIVAMITFMAISTPANAAIDFYRVGKTIAYKQTSNDPPTTPSTFYGGVDMFTTTPGDFTTARVFSTTTMPPSPVPEFVLSEFSSGYWGASLGYSSLEDMDANLPPGDTFGFLIEGGALGAQLALLPLPPDNLFSPTVPHYTGDTYSRFQDVDTTAPLAVNWNGYTPADGINSAPIFFSVYRVSDGQTATSTVMDNTGTSYQIPANALAPDTHYRASLDYSSRKNTVDAGFNGADAAALFDVVTEIDFTTNPFLAGDYNRNKIVDAADYTVWRNSLGQIGLSAFSGADGDGDGKILPADYSIWKTNYGVSSFGSGTAATNVPEPALASILIWSWILIAATRRMR